LSVWMEEAAKFLADDGWRDQRAGQIAIEEAVR